MSYFAKIELSVDTLSICKQFFILFLTSSYNISIGTHMYKKKNLRINPKSVVCTHLCLEILSLMPIGRDKNFFFDVRFFFFFVCIPQVKRIKLKAHWTWWLVIHEAFGWFWISANLFGVPIYPHKDFIVYPSRISLIFDAMPRG